MAAFVIMMGLEAQNRNALRRERVFRDRNNVLDILNSDAEFITRYRFPRHIILMLVDECRDLIHPKTYRSHSIPAHIQVLVCLRFLAKGDYLSEIADIHGISKSSGCVIVHRVIGALCSVLNNIVFPTSAEDLRKMKIEFFKIAAFPNVIGAIDGTQIAIQGMSSDDEHLYVCRKGYHAINVQAVVDPGLRFTNAVCKYPGSTHDSFILQSSGLVHIVENIQDGWLLGDSGYPLKEWLMTPISHPRNRQEERYNSSHCRTRNVIERAFGVLKARFRCIHKTGGSLPYKPPKCAKIIECCMRLHNLAVEKNVPLIGDVEDEVNEIPVIQPGQDLNNNASALRQKIVERF